MDYNITENATKNSLMQKHFLKEKNVEIGQSSSSKRLSERNQNTQRNIEKKFLFPKHCYFCKKNRITVNKKRRIPLKQCHYSGPRNVSKIGNNLKTIYHYWG